MSLTRRVVSWLLVALLLGASFIALLNKQWIIDYVSYSNYSPTTEIAEMVTRSGMSDNGRFYFYSSHPEVANSEVFNSSCERHEKTSPILGCYVHPGNKVYIYDVTDPDLDGIKEVTAAHEMLHVAYARLGQSQQEWLATRLEDAYKRLKTDNLALRMDYYEAAEPGSRVNELHSILATEFRDLGAELENYYAKYFSKRQAVVGLYEQYSSKFYALEEESSALADQLKIDLVGIETMSGEYERDLARLNQAVIDFNARAASGYFTSQEQFESERVGLTARTEELMDRHDRLGRVIDEYNKGVERLNTLGLRIDKLNKSIDSFEEIQ